MNDDISQRARSDAMLVAHDQVEPGRVESWGSLGRISLPDRVATDLEESEFALNIAVVHQDAVTRGWATQVTNHAIQLVGECSVRNTWWKTGELRNPRVFGDAIQAATRADILIVSVRATDALPLDLYEWVEAWLSLRLPLAGAVVALIGVPEQSGADSARIGQYLQDVARRGQLEFLFQQQELPLDLPGVSMEEIAERAPTTTQDVGGIIDPGHWGINE